MHCITITLADTATVWTLLYQQADVAQAGWQQFLAAKGEVELSDDFGQIALVDRSRVAGAMFEDLDKSMQAHIERGLHNARTQAKAQERATNDPVLKTAAMMRGNGPAIFSPMGTNGHG